LYDDSSVKYPGLLASACFTWGAHVLILWQIRSKLPFGAYCTTHWMDCGDQWMHYV